MVFFPPKLRQWREIYFPLFLKLITFCKRVMIFKYAIMPEVLFYLFSILKISQSAPHAHMLLFARIVSYEQLCQDQPVLFLKAWEEQKYPQHKNTVVLRVCCWSWAPYSSLLSCLFVSCQLSDPLAKGNLFIIAKIFL